MVKYGNIRMQNILAAVDLKALIIGTIDKNMREKEEEQPKPEQEPPKNKKKTLRVVK